MPLPHPINILLVDDKARNLAALEVTLGSVDCGLVRANSGREALECVLAQDFAVILLDVHMPDMDGFETARLIHARGRSHTTPIIFLTADGSIGTPVSTGYGVGAIDYMHQPFDPEILRSKVNVLVELFRKTVAVDQRNEELLDVNEQLQVAGVESQKRAETEIKLRGEAEAALTMRDEFISIAAHELRTPVTRIKTSAQYALLMLEEDAIPDMDKTKRYLRDIVGDSNRLVLLIKDLMDVSRIRSGELLLSVAKLDLAKLVNTVALLYAETVGGRHHVTTNVPLLPVVVVGDDGRLGQILDNLLNNAVKYSPDGGEIGVSLRQDREGGIVLAVSDAGMGLPPGAQERIFEPFGRAANASRRGVSGMGLGLHICKQIAEAHGGRMWAESDGEGYGMTVSMWLPLAVAAGVSNAPNSSGGSGSAHE